MAANEVSGTKLEELELFYEELRQANGHPLWVRDPNPAMQSFEHFIQVVPTTKDWPRI